mmetsp:Transcript_23153/g.36913  ORF Transcript_23153/g.36913 Transcript_23153/m.36913 type:complete len:91 (+) Transcript_23153:398-670(+)
MTHVAWGLQVLIFATRRARTNTNAVLASTAPSCVQHVPQTFGRHPTPHDAKQKTVIGHRPVAVRTSTQMVAGKRTAGGPGSLRCPTALAG